MNAIAAQQSLQQVELTPAIIHHAAMENNVSNGGTVGSEDDGAAMG